MSNNIIKNEAQEKAINTINGPVILISVPGSGKTTTMVRRIHHMIETGIDPDSILMMTFSKNAANDMKARYSSLFGEQPGVTFCTIHSFCLAILSKFRGFSAENVLDTNSQYGFFYEQLRGYRSIGDKNTFISDLLLDIGNIKNNEMSARDYDQTCCSDHALFVKLYDAYEDFKYKTHKIDYDDMLTLACDEIYDNPACLDFLQGRYRYVMVDEYQDTNLIQSKIIYKLCEKERNICVVGDDDQSIYAFRGAQPKIMLDFTKKFPDAVVINNDTNYRSVPDVVGYADSLIVHNQERYRKEFKAFRNEAGKVSLNGCPTRQFEIDAVVAEIMNLLKTGKKPTDIAVLYRTNRQSGALAEKMLAKSIPVYSNEKIESKYDSFIWTDVLSYYRLSAGNGTNFDVAQTLNHPNRYLYGSGYYEKGLDHDQMLRTALKTPGEEWKRRSAIDKVDDYFALIVSLQGKSPAEFLKTLAAKGYKDYIVDYSNFRKIPSDEYLSVYRSIIEDAKKCATWEELIAYANRYNTIMRTAVRDPNGVTLSTMHGAKGLEWDTVFIIDAVDGVCPYTKATSVLELEEERRLFYVAVTRAKNNLHVCWYRMNDDKCVDPSPYISEMTVRKRKEEEKRRLEEARKDTRTLGEKLKEAGAVSSSGTL